MRIVITGASGFVGRRLVDLLGSEHEVYGLSRTETSRRRSIQIDLSADFDLGLLPDKVDAVVHLAQSELYRDFPERAGHIYSVNVASTFRLLDYARRGGARRFVLASSGGVYGYANGAVTESSAMRPPDFYLRTKQLAEILLSGYESFFVTVALRPFFVYGLGQRPTMFIPRLVRNVLHGNPITVSPPDGLLVNPIHVTDAVRAFAHALTVDFSGAVNVAGPDVLSLGEIVRMIARQLNREPVIEKVAESPGNVVGDVSLMSRVLGAPSVRFADGIVEVCSEAMAELAIEER
jgi:UDP-glucose 4-epimerase